MKRTMKMVMLAALVGAVGCAGGEKKESQTAVNEAAPPPPTNEKIEQAKAQQQEKAQAQKPLTREEKKKKAMDRADFDGAVKRWEELRKAGPLKAADARSLADKFKSIAGSHPEVAAQAHYNAGNLAQYAGDEKDAESEFNAALSSNPAYGPALNSLGELYYRQGSMQRAKDWFQKGIDADPTHNAPAYNNLALILFKEARDQGNAAGYKEAVSKLRRALAIDNNSMPAYALLALIYYNASENDRSKLSLAEVVVKQAKETDDKYAPIYNTNGLILLRKANVTGALKEFERAVDLDPRFVEAHLNIGAIGLSSRQYEKAQKAFEQVLALQPSNVDATIGLGVALRGQKKVEEAEKYYQAAKKLDPKNCAVPYNLGVLYQDYKNLPDNSNLRDAQKFYNEYAQCGRTDKTKLADAQRRIKDIDDTFAALEQQKKMEAEVKAQQEEMEKQQKAMEEQMKQQQEAAKAAEANKPPAEDKSTAPKGKK
jgi:tetratricopeptide (TPR) repeat protein